MRRCALAICLVVLLTPIGHAAAAPCWLPPVIGTVVDPFREPPCPYCPGNRGLEYRVGSNAAVYSVASGTVSWSGEIDDTRYVVVRLASGWRLTYGKLASTHLATGDRVLARTRVGRASGEFYFGVRSGDTYIDPAPYLGRLIGRPRLVPVDGTQARAAPAPRLRCESSSSRAAVAGRWRAR